MNNAVERLIVEPVAQQPPAASVAVEILRDLEQDSSYYLLTVPLLASFKIVCEKLEPLQSVATFLAP